MRYISIFQKPSTKCLTTICYLNFVKFKFKYPEIQNFTIFIIVVLFDCKTYSIRTYSVPKDFYSKDIHGLNADGLSLGLISREYILPVVCVVIRRHNLQSHFAVSLELIKQSKHGTTCIALPSRLFVIDLTVHVDISPNPGPAKVCSLLRNGRKLKGQ